MCTADSANTLTEVAKLKKKMVNNRFKEIAPPRVIEAVYEAVSSADHFRTLIALLLRSWT